jgi:hypothetical protein
MLWRCALVVTAIVAAMAIASSMAPPSAWRETVAWAKARRVELDAARVRAACPVLVGDAVATDVRTAWQNALAVAAGLEAGNVPCGGRRHGEELAWDAASDARALACEPALAALRSVARAPDNPGPCDDTFGLLSLVDAWLVRAFAPGRPAAAAVDDVLDALACAIDLAAAAEPLLQIVGVRLVATIVAAVDDPWIDALPAAELARFARALAVADPAFASTTTLPAELAVHLVEHLLASDDPSALDVGLRSQWHAWQHGFSVRRSGVARATRLVAAVAAFEAMPRYREPSPARREAMARLAAQDKHTNADLLAPYLAGIAEEEAARNHAAAALRVLHVACCAAVGGDVPARVDPCAAVPITVTRDGIVVRCRAPSGSAARQLRSRS